MISTSKKKAALRWAGIFTVTLSYYIWLAIAILSFGHIDEKESMRFLEDVVSEEYHQAIVKSIYHATDNVIEVASIGFPIGMILILVIFKKVR
jgi:hypothetical protein